MLMCRQKKKNTRFVYLTTFSIKQYKYIISYLVFFCFFVFFFWGESLSQSSLLSFDDQLMFPRTLAPFFLLLLLLLLLKMPRFNFLHDGLAWLPALPGGGTIVNVARSSGSAACKQNKTKQNKTKQNKTKQKTY